MKLTKHLRAVYQPRAVWGNPSKVTGKAGMPSLPSFLPISCAEEKLKIKRVWEKSKRSSLPSVSIVWPCVWMIKSLLFWWIQLLRTREQKKGFWFGCLFKFPCLFCDGWQSFAEGRKGRSEERMNKKWWNGIVFWQCDVLRLLCYMITWNAESWCN